MKKEVVAYITGAINSYSKALDVLRENNIASSIRLRFEAVKDELTELLDYVEDVQERKPIDQDNLQELDEFKHVIEKDWSIILKLSHDLHISRRREKDLEAENSRLQNTCNQLREENECLMHGSKGYKIS